MTKLSAFADRMMEAGWIAAIITAPLFFNVFSSRIFEPDKITLLRSISLLVLVSWIIKALEAPTKQHRSSFSLKQIFQIPLMLLVMLLIFSYLISTLLSVAPLVSLWGSYQRLQGTFTTYSYLILFLSIVFNRPSENQIQRLVTILIAVSLPVAVYGMLQRYKIDPIPWGGDVSVRIASTMGNSIFVAAYLIMVFPLTLGRVFNGFRRMLRSDSFELRDFLLSTTYVFIGLLQVVAMYFSGSRGPALGWLASLFFFALCIIHLTKRRNWGLVILSLSILVMIFLAVFNLPNSPFESLKGHPSIGRFGQLLDPQSNNARVRTYIWQGAVKLYGFHPPLEYPEGGKDRFNWLRPLIGYGPETMYVAYNRFYVPELTQVERRNASPDRSHNETWDALIFTGAIGFVVYISLFLSLFYYGFQKLGLIISPQEKKWFWWLEILMGGLFSIGMIVWRGVAYFGVAFPIGMIVGLFGYLSLKLWFMRGESEKDENERSKLVLLASILSAFLAHLIEINFGIAIVATRTTFWVLAAILVVLVSEKHPEIVLEQQVLDKKEVLSKRKRRSGFGDTKASQPSIPPNIAQPLVLGTVVGFILVVLGYNFMNATELGSSALQIIWSSFTEVRKEASFRSNGILIVISLAWLFSAQMLIGEDDSIKDNRKFLVQWLQTLAVGLGFGLVYWLIHGNLLALIVAKQINNVQEILERIRQYEGLLIGFYLSIFILMVAFALFDRRANNGDQASFNRSQSLMIGILCLLLSCVIIYQRNIRIIQADIAFKLGESFSKPGSWPVSIQIYQHAIELAPREDYYYLFLGRSYLEYAREINDASQRESLFAQAKADLSLARALNPLNTDHTANLARLYSLWSLNTQDEKLKDERFQESNRYFEQATSLSPNNSRIWGEWAVLLMSKPETHSQALPKLMTAYQLDPAYDWVAYLFGEYYRIQAFRIESAEERKPIIELSISNYLKAANLAEDANNKRTYALMAAQLAIEGDLASQAISALESVLAVPSQEPDNWKYEQLLAQLYLQLGERDKALSHAQNALMFSPPDQRQAIEEFIQTISP